MQRYGHLKKNYRYTAISGSGEKIKGSFSATSTAEAIAYLNSRSLYIVNLKESKSLRLFWLALLQLDFIEKLRLHSLNSRDFMLFCRQLATMLQTGIPLLHALKVLAGQTGNIVFKQKLNNVLQAVEVGSSFAGALVQQGGFFPPFFIGMVETGETAGALDTIMDRMAVHYEKQHDLEEKLRSATAYPLFISAMALAVIMVMIVFVLPQFANIFNSYGMQMPLLSRIMLNFGRLVAAYWPLMLILPLLFFIFLNRAIKTGRGRLLYDHLLFKLPVFGKIFRQTATARFSRSLSTLLASGIALHQALNLADRIVNNLVFSHAIADLEKALTRGNSLSEPLKDAHVFPPLLIEMIRVGEESGTLDYTLNKTALFYEREIAYQVDRIGSLLEPILLLAVGLFIGLIVYSVMSPMYRVFQLI